MARYHVYAIGNALVDSEFDVSEQELTNLSVDKGLMTLIDKPRREELDRALDAKDPRLSCGGSAANTVIAVAQFGGKGFYSCKIANDRLGQFYADDLQRNGVDSNLDPKNAQAGDTGTCYVLVTPDAERSMNSFLGATTDIGPDALSPDALANADIYYMEGYLAASPSGSQAALQGREMARTHNAKLALTLSDVNMVNFCRDNLETMLGDGVDYLFCNEDEAAAWCQTSDIEQIIQQLSARSKVLCLTRGPKGCIVCADGATQHIPTQKITAIDTNGAGDLFAGAFLYGQTHGLSSTESAKLANIAATMIVGKHGNRLSNEDIQTVTQAYRDA